MDLEKHILPGRKGVSEVLRHRPSAIRRLIQREGARFDESLSRQLQEAAAAGIPSEVLKKTVFDEFTAGHQTQGLVAVVEPLVEPLDSMAARVVADGGTLVVCDQIADPHNLGAILRVSEAAGVGGVVVTKDRSTEVTPTVRKVSAGASELLPICRVANLQRSLKELKSRGFWIVGAALGAESSSIYEAPDLTPTALVVGSEGTGVRQLTKKHCDVLVEIPMSGRIGSINVSQAVSVILFELYRKRLQQQKGEVVGG